MSLLDHAIFWHVYPLGACGAPIRPTEPADGHRLSRLEAWLDYVIELGCSALLLGPIFASTSHGYDTVDYFRIDPRLGDQADFDQLVTQAHRRGLSVVLDGVFNHVGVNHRLVDEAISDGAGLVRLEAGPEGPRPAGWEGHGDLAELDHANPAVAELVTEVMLHWLRRGIAGWRLDVAYAVPSAFWATVIGRVREEFPDAVFIGEVIHGDYPKIIAESGMDTLTQYELWKAIWSSISDVNFWELAWALERHAEFAEAFLPQTFIGNHDVTRIATQVGESGAVVAAAVLFTLPGTPSIYYGDEQGFCGQKGEGLGADDALRPALPDTPEQLAPHGEWMLRVYQQLIALRRRNPWLTRSRVDVLDKTNQTISYVLIGEGHRAEVGLALAPQVSVEISVDGQGVFTWRG